MPTPPLLSFKDIWMQFDKVNLWYTLGAVCLRM